MATRHGHDSAGHAVLRRLTAAALALPGLLPCMVSADGGSDASLAYSRYEESRRRVHGNNHGFAPLRADTLSAHASSVYGGAWQASLDFSEDTWSGATPVTTLPLAAMSPLSDAQLLAGASAKPSTGQVTPALVDAAMHPYVNSSDKLFQPRYERDERVIHMMTSASPETRKEGHGQLTHAWRDVSMSVGGGVSDERDYHAGVVDVGGRFDFDRKRSTVAFAIAHSLARAQVTLPSTWLGWVDTRIAEQQGIVTRGEAFADGTPRLEIDKNRRDWNFALSMTRVASRYTLIEVALGYRHAAGYLDNSYRAMSFLSRGADVERVAEDGSPLHGATLFHSYERRPTRRGQWSVDLALVQDLPFTKASLHADYRYFRDDWSVTAHTLELAWHQALGPAWNLVPRARFYGQSAASFYRAYVDCGLTPGYDCALGLGHYSSDYRLAAFGAVSAGLGVSHRFDSGITLDLDGEYYLHRGALGLGRRPTERFADFEHYRVSAALGIDFDALAGHVAHAAASTAPHGEHAHHHGGGHAMPPVPAGIMDGHMLDRAGQWMLGYRYQFAGQSGRLAHGRHAVSDAAVVAGGRCDPPGCGVRPASMYMHMHMVDIMFAPTARWTLAVMPQFVDMNMRLAPLAGGAALVHATHDGHASGGIGDVQVANLVRLFERRHHHLHATLGMSVPSGHAGQRLNPVAGHDHDPSTVKQPEYVHYGMQLGSGTWDVNAGLVYLGDRPPWHWGARVALTSRLGQRNGAGYAWGDKFESSAWLGYALTPDITLTLRGLAAVQGRLKGRFDAHREQDVSSGVVTWVENSITGPMDSPASYGGRYYDVGIGAHAQLPASWRMGSQLAIEWLEPLAETLHGYQLRRAGALYVNWSVMF
jgi:hypothetical protein